MNKKRQTVWLVSMLSIMVILSAYYLFTEDKQPEPLHTATSNDEDWNNMVIDMLSDDYVLSGVELSESPATEETEYSIEGDMPEGDMPESNMPNEHSSSLPSDYEFEAQTVSSAEYFIGLEMAREDYFATEIEKLHEIATNPAESNETVVAALEQIESLRTQQEKIEQIEDQLNQYYDRAVVLQQQEKWQVIVQTDKLEKSEASSIISLMLNELGVSSSSVSVAVRSD